MFSYQFINVAHYFLPFKTTENAAKQHLESKWLPQIIPIFPATTTNKY